jgi:hypothetical protein
MTTAPEDDVKAIAPQPVDSNTDGQQTQHAKAQVHPNAVATLTALMEADPYIRKRLCGTTSNVVSAAAFDDNSNAAASPDAAKREDILDCDIDMDWTHVEKWNSVAVKFDASSGHVAHLDLSGHRIKYLPFEPFETFKELQTLNLGGTDVPVAQLVEAVKHCCSTLQNLHLGGNGLRDVGLMTLVPELVCSKAPHLKKLDVRYNDIGPVGVAALSETLGQNECECAIELLYLEGNDVGDKGAASLATALTKENACLKELFLGSNHIETSGALSLAASLERNTTLTKLYLEGNRIGSEGGAAFSEALEKFNGEATLKKLFVDNNGLGKEQSERLARALNSGSTIGEMC